MSMTTNDPNRRPCRVKVQGDLFHGRIPDGALYVGRNAPGLSASLYSNPFAVKKYGLEASRALFRTYLTRQPELIRQARRDLAGRDLACWCKTGAGWCHADDWLLIAAGGSVGDLTRE